MTRILQPYVTTGLPVSRLGPSVHERHSLSTRSQTSVRRQSSVSDRASCLYVAIRSSCVATRFLGIQGDLGGDKDFLCLDRALLRPCVMTQQVCRDWLLNIFCRNRESLDLGFPMSRHSSCVTTRHNRGMQRQSVLDV